eukprot:469747-Alexandrium_andersonii.AAC.1
MRRLLENAARKTASSSHSNSQREHSQRTPNKPQKTKPGNAAPQNPLLPRKNITLTGEALPFYAESPHLAFGGSACATPTTACDVSTAPRS